MLENLFSSKILFKILALLFQNQNRPLSTSEIIKVTGKGQANVARELQKLVKWGLVLKTKHQNQFCYALDSKSQYFSTLENLFNVYNSDKNPRYILLNEEGGTAILPWDFFLRGFSSQLGVERGVLKRRLSNCAHFQGDYGKVFFEKSSWEENARDALRWLIARPQLVTEIIYPESLAKGQRAFEIFEQARTANFKIDKARALQITGEFIDIIGTQIALNTVAVFDLADQPLSSYLQKYLMPKVKAAGRSLGEVMEKLLAPPLISFTQRLRLAMLKLALKKPASAERTAELKIIARDYSWLNYGYRGTMLDVDFFDDYFSGLAHHSMSELKAEIREIENWENLIKARKEDEFENLKIDVAHRTFIEALALLSFFKVYRKDISFLALYTFYEILKNLGLDVQKNNQLFLTLDEVREFLNGGSLPSSEVLKERSNGCVQFFSGEPREILTGAAAAEFLNKSVVAGGAEMPAGASVKLLEGVTACLGKTGDWIYGVARIINNPADMIKMNQGDILLSVATTPDILPAMKKAGAIVTDYGGITSHAAIVSRELNVPCLIGTKYATKLFKDGDKVIVCPRHGYIKFQ